MKNFSRVMDLLDLATLDHTFLECYPSQLAAAALLVVLPDTHALLQPILPYSITSLRPVIERLHQLNKFPARSTPASVCIKPYADLKIPPEDMYTRQPHSVEFIKFLRSQPPPSAPAPMSGLAPAKPNFAKPRSFTATATTGSSSAPPGRRSPPAPTQCS